MAAEIADAPPGPGRASGDLTGVALVEAKRLAWEMAEAGESVDAIADTIEVRTGVRPSGSQISSWNTSAVARVRRNLHEEARDVMMRDNAAIEELLRTWLPQARADVQALNGVVKLFERRSKMWGYDQPSRKEVAHTVEPERLVVQSPDVPKHLNEARAGD